MSGVLNRLRQISGKADATPAEHAAPELDDSGNAIPPSRRKKKAIMSWHDPVVGDQLKQLAKEQRVSQQQLLREALNLLFAHYRKDEIA